MKHSMDSELRQLTYRDYPEGLRHIPQPPELLWARGSFAATSTKHLAVVGSRALSPYGRDACKELIQGLKGSPVSIVSGLALGADAVAHEAALDAGLHTIAVLGSGVSDRAISPRTNFPLAARILGEGGLLLSESAPDHVPLPSDFPRRNRLVVGLSDAVLIVEAGERSGTLITARLASEYNRDLLCIPHRIHDAHGYGAHLFIRLGAALVSTPEHILEALGLSKPVQEADQYLSANEEYVLELLHVPERVELVCNRSSLSEEETRAALVLLEIKGLARQQFGKWQRAS